MTVHAHSMPSQREGKVVVGDGAQRSHSGHLRRAGCSAIDAVLPDPVMSVLRLIFVAERLVYKPTVISSCPAEFNC